MIIALISIVCGIILRLLLPRRLSGFNESSIKLFIFLFVLRVIPAIALSFCTLSIFHSFFQGNSIAVYPFWSISQLILVIPFLLSFVLFIHFDLSYKEITYYKLIKIGLRELIKIHFYKKYLVSYLLVLLFSVSFIWNEDSATSMLSVYVPSANIELFSKSVGRSTDYSFAANLIVPNLIIIALALLLWTKISNKLIIQNN
jgi:hypothetical protein